MGLSLSGRRINEINCRTFATKTIYSVQIACVQRWVSAELNWQFSKVLWECFSKNYGSKSHLPYFYQQVGRRSPKVSRIFTLRIRKGRVGERNNSDLSARICSECSQQLSWSQLILRDAQTSLDAWGRTFDAKFILFGMSEVLKSSLFNWMQSILALWDLKIATNE